MLILLIVLLVLSALLLIGLSASKVEWGSPAINWIDGWVRLLCRYLHRQSDQQIALPEHGPAIVVANHISGLDPLLLVSASRRPIRFLIATEEYERPGLHWLFKAAGCIPVDRKGRPEVALRQALRALQQGEVIALFPHGTIHLDADPPRPIKGGVARLAAWSHAMVFPVRIDGVRAQGTTLIAPFVPSRVQLTLPAPLSCDEDQLAPCLAAITQAIAAPPSQ